MAAVKKQEGFTYASGGRWHHKAENRLSASYVITFGEPTGLAQIDPKLEVGQIAEKREVTDRGWGDGRGPCGFSFQAGYCRN